jgi:hypothetical protein
MSDVRLEQCAVPLDDVEAPLTAGLRDMTRGAIGKGVASSPVRCSTWPSAGAGDAASDTVSFTTMTKSIAIALVILLLGLLAWVVFQSSDISIIVNGQKLAGPAKLAAEGWGFLVAIVALLCAAILLAFVFAGIWLIILGALVLAGMVGVWLAFPFLLPLLIPLFLVWIFVAVVRGRGKPGS